MNILKHMEAVFVATVAFAVSGAYLIDAIPTAHAKAPLIASADAIPVITVVAKRMSAEEKAQSLREERSANAVSRL